MYMYTEYISVCVYICKVYIQFPLEWGFNTRLLNHILAVNPRFVFLEWVVVVYRKVGWIFPMQLTCLFSDLETACYSPLPLQCLHPQHCWRIYRTYSLSLSPLHWWLPWSQEHLFLGMKQMPPSSERPLKYTAKADPPGLPALLQVEREGPSLGEGAGLVSFRSREHWRAWVLSLSSPALPFCPFFIPVSPISLHRLLSLVKDLPVLYNSLFNLPPLLQLQSASLSCVPICHWS